MHRLSARIAPLLRTSVRRLPEENSGIISDSIHHLLPYTILPEPRWPSPGLTVAAEIPGREAFESFNPCATYFRSLPVLDQRIDRGTLCLRQYSTFNERDDIALEEEVERKAGWLLKLIFIVTAVGVASQFYPYIGDNLLQQSISLLHVKDPLFKRMGASRLRRFAIDDERRMKVVEMGGARDLLTMLESAKDDKTRKEALKALLALSHSDAAAEALQQAGAADIVASTPDFSEFVEIGDCKSSLLKRFRELEHNQSPSEIALS